MSETLVLWIFGTLIGVLGVLIAFLARWLQAVSKELADFRAEVPKLYPSETDVKRVEDTVKEVGRELRADLNAFMREVRQDVGTLAAAVNQVVGASQNRG